MSPGQTVLHTASTVTLGGRESGTSRSSDGVLDIRLSPPGWERIGTNPEQLFAAGWSASFESAIALAARRRMIALTDEVRIHAEIDLNFEQGEYSLSACLSIKMPGLERTTASLLVDEAHRTCPYSKATRHNIEVTIRLIENE